MGTEKRERQKAGRMARLEEEMRQAQAQKRNRAILRGVIIAALVIGLIVVYSLVTGGDDEPAAVATDTSPTEPIDPKCPNEDGSSERQTQFTGPPPTCIDPEQKYIAEFATTEGDIDVLIDPSLDEISANNFIFLARYHAYDGTLFHRIINDFMVQGGDVQFQSGTGNPGYRFTGGVPDTGEYRVGSIAMANSGDSSSNGSQFFIVTGSEGVGLPPLYSLFGHVVDGLDVALAMQGVATGPGDAPVEDVVANTVTIREATDDEIAAYEAAVSG